VFGAQQPLRARLGLVAAGILLVALLPPSASAHSFLIRSDPSPGSRLVTAPATLTLSYGEPFVRGSERVSLRRVGGSTVTLPPPRASGAMIRQALPPKLRGVFVVSWRVLSDDGHVSLGEFAFDVGAGGSLPATLSSSGGGTSPGEVAAGWLFFVGLALALGGAVSERLIWRSGRRGAGQVSRAPVGVGLAAAALGDAWLLLLLAGAERGGGFGAGLSTGAIGDAIARRPGELTLVALLAVLAAAPPLRAGRLRVLVVLPLAVAVVATSLRGHSGTSGDWWAAAADVVHLAASALWFGALAHLLLALLRAGRPRELLAAAVGSYSRLALPTVLLVIASGIATAIPQFGSLHAVVSSSYGRTMLIKAGLIGVALSVALLARRRALSANPHPRWSLLRRLAGVEAVALIGVLLAVAVLVNSAPPRSLAASRGLGPLAPPSLTPAVRLADMAGELVVGVAVTERELQFTVAPPSEQPRESVKLTADAVEPGGRAFDLFPRSCGPECFSIRYRLKPGLNVITAHVRSSVWRGGDARFEISWPLPADRPQLIRRVAATTRAVPSLGVTESVVSGPGSGAPASGYRLSGRQFVQSEGFAGAVDVRVLGRAGGLTELAFELPGSQMWYRMWIDRHYRLRREQILEPGHLIRRTFSYSRQPSSATASPPPAQPRAGALAGAPPPPPAGAFVVGREADDLAIGLAAKRAGNRIELQTTVAGGDGKGESALTVRYRLRASGGETAAPALLCGSGCYRALLPRRGRPRSLLVTIAGPGRRPSSLAFVLPSRWSPPQASALLRRATSAWQQLRSLVIKERLGSDATHVLHTRYELEAPDKLSYRIAGGSQAVVIGARRWDRQPGQPWKESSATRLSEPALQWTRATNVRLFGSGTVAGRPVWVISFYDPSFGGFFEIWVDKTSGRTLQLTLIAAAHFMHHRYSHFNAPLTVVAPADTR
jgi:copper transport protein